MTYYLIRFDDINPRMNWIRFNQLKSIINKYNIKSILGVVPKCEDLSISNFPENKNYLNDLQKMKSEGDLIAQHGFTHINDSKNKGLYGNVIKSEFAGLDYSTQYERIKEGKNILIKSQLWQPIFMAPFHSFDKTTILVLRHLGFQFITDGFSRYPYEQNGIKFIPQFSSMPLPTNLPLISQLCIHVNTLNDDNFNFLENFIEKNNDLFISPIEALKFENNNIFIKIENQIIGFLIKSYRNLKKISIKSKIKYLINKIFCIAQRTKYRILFKGMNIDPWHLSGTFYCREYKIKTLEIIKKIKPNYYIDIGCGLGEILNKVELSEKNKFGFDIDYNLTRAVKKLNSKIFFSSNKEKFFNHLSNNIKGRNNIIIVSLLNFAHTISDSEFSEYLIKLHKILGPYILITDSVFDKSKEYRFSHKTFLDKQENILEYIESIDEIRSLYCILIKNKIVR